MRTFVLLGTIYALMLLATASMAYAETAGPDSEERVKVRVTADRVNLRSRPNDESEIVFQVSNGDLLFATTDLDTEWIEVLPPADANLWIYSELVRGGVVAATKVLVRSGPGVQYRDVGRVERGEKLTVRGSRGDWLKIAPPAGSVLWINRTYIQPATLSTKKPEPVRASVKRITDITTSPAARVGKLVRKPPKPALGQLRNLKRPARLAKHLDHDADWKAKKVSRPWSVAERDAPSSLTSTEPRYTVDSRQGYARKQAWKPPKPTGKRREAVKFENASDSLPLPAGLSRKNLVSSRKQGQKIEVVGVLRPSGLVWRRPSKYRLVNRSGKRPAVTVCYVLGNEAQLASIVGHTLLIYGREYWLQAVRHSVVVPEQIIRKD